MRVLLSLKSHELIKKKRVSILKKESAKKGRKVKKKKKIGKDKKDVLAFFSRVNLLDDHKKVLPQGIGERERSSKYKGKGKMLQDDAQRSLALTRRAKPAPGGSRVLVSPARVAKR